MTAPARPVPTTGVWGARRLPVRLLLTLLAAALVPPGLLFSTVLLDRVAGSERARYTARALGHAEPATNALDRELVGFRAASQALATSPALAEGNLVAFEAQARAVKGMIGQTLVLVAPDGRGLLDARLPFGVPLPRAGKPEPYRRALEGQRLVVSDLSVDAVARGPVLSVVVPVLRGAEAAYALAIVLTPDHLSGVPHDRGLPPLWVGGRSTGWAPSWRVAARRPLRGPTCHAGSARQRHGRTRYLDR